MHTAEKWAHAFVSPSSPLLEFYLSNQSSHTSFVSFSSFFSNLLTADNCHPLQIVWKTLTELNERKILSITWGLLSTSTVVSSPPNHLSPVTADFMPKQAMAPICSNCCCFIIFPSCCSLLKIFAWITHLVHWVDISAFWCSSCHAYLI